MADLLSSRALRRWLPWLLIVVAALVLPVLLPPFRLNLLGRFLSLGIVALGVDLIWGFTGLLSLGQGIFFALGGYALAMYLTLHELKPGELPEFFSLYGVKGLPAFWQPFGSPLFTLLAIWVIPAFVAGALGYLVFRNRIKGGLLLDPHPGCFAGVLQLLQWSAEVDQWHQWFENLDGSPLR